MNRSGACINGREIETGEGLTILAAARQLKIEIPTLCHVEGLAPEGGCRLCMVETADGSLHAACHTLLEPDMVIETESDRLAHLRRELVKLVVQTMPDGGAREMADSTPLGRLMSQFGVAPLEISEPHASVEVDTSHPYIHMDLNRCIHCRQCLNVCEQVQGQFVYGVEGRGPKTRLAIGANDRFVDSECTACGACVDGCPTGALSDRDRDWEAGPAPDNVVESVCGYCGVGCRVRIESAGGRVLRIEGVSDAKVNRGHLCAKGRHAHAYHHHPDRLKLPRRRIGDQWETIGWDTAMAWAAERLEAVRSSHGADGLGAITSSRSTNEAGYLLGKFFRTAVGTNNVDCCARICHSSTALALQLVTGTGAASASYQDIDRARCIVVAGANPTEAHPVVGARIKQAVLKGATLIVIDPRRIELAEYADVHLPLQPGTNVGLFNAMAQRLIETGRYAKAYVAERTEGIESFIEFGRRLDIAEMVRRSGVSIDQIHRAADLIGEAGPTLFVHGLGLSELTQGTASVMALCNLGMLSGSIGRPGAGMLPLRGQNNVQGHADMGSMPDRVTGYQALDDPDTRKRLDSLWGSAPPLKPGWTTTQMLEAADEGRLHGLWIQGEDVIQSEPLQDRTVRALQKLDFLVVQDLFPCQTTEHAHLVLPAAGALEQEGTFTNGERRIQHVRPAVDPPGDARPDWQVIQEVANAMGAGWSYEDASQVMDEIAQVAPRLFGGIRYDRLAGDGLQWPCPAPDHPGTATVHGQGFLRGLGRLVCIDDQPSPEHDLDAFPYLLITGRVLHQYNVGTMTRRTPSQELAPDDRLEIHPADLHTFGVGDGDRVTITSRWGRVAAEVRSSERVQPGVLFMSFHHPESHTNRLVGPHLDPQSHCPQYKATAVRLECDDGS